MGLITEPPDFVDGNDLLATELNTVKERIYDEFNGLIDDTNVKSGAAIGRTKVADTALVQSNSVGAGLQTVTRPTAPSAGAWRLDTTTADRETINLDGVATTFVVATTSRFKLLTRTDANSPTITTVTGGTAGLVITLVCDNSGAGSIVIAHTNTNLLNSFKFKNPVGAAETRNVDATDDRGTLGTFVYGDLNGSSTNQWWEL